MKDLYLSSEELYDLESAFPNVNNTESVLYRYNNYILKVFNTINPYDLNRLKARLSFWQQKQYDFLINPEFLLYIDKEFNGFGAKEFPSKNIENYSRNISFEEKIRILKIFSLTLKKAHNNGIIIGDLNNNNVLTNGKEIKFCDINSMGFVGAISPLMIPCTLERNMNISEWDKGTIKSDIFLINTMVLNILITNHEFPFYLSINNYMNNYMNKINLPGELYDMFIHIYDIFNESNPIYPHEYLDTIKEYKRTRQNF